MQTSEIQAELKKGLRTFKVFEKADELITFFAGLEQNVRELQTQIAKLKDDLAKDEAVANAALKSLADQRAAAERDADAAKAAADRAGKKEFEAAKAKADSMVNKAAADVANAQAVQAKAEEAAVAAEARVAEAEKSLADLTQRIEAAKAQIAKLLG